MLPGFFSKRVPTPDHAKATAPVTVVLNIWKRKYLAEQLRALAGQTTVPKSIWVVHYENHVAVDKYLKGYPNVTRLHCTRNLKYFGRFSLANHVDTPYTWMLDDDIIPSPTWVETCLRTSETYNAIVCPNGRLIDRGDYTPEVAKTPDYLERHFIGDARPPYASNYCPADTFVDYGCSSFFFRTEWLRHFWSVWPATFGTGEDMHLSAACKIRAGIPTVVPRQLTAGASGNVKPEYSSDDHASWMQAGFIEQRREVLRYLINEQGWRPVQWQQPVAVAN